MKTKIMLPIIFIIGILVACGDNSKQKQVTLADAFVKKIESGQLLQLDKSKTEDIVNLIGKSADNISRGTDDIRNLEFKFEDGSSIIFSMKPIPGQGGLVLYAYQAN